MDLGLAVAQFDVGNGNAEAGNYLPIQLALDIDLIAAGGGELDRQFGFESFGVALK